MSIEGKFECFRNGTKFPEKVSRESFTKFHKVSPSFNKRGKMIKTVLYLSFVNFQSRVEPMLVLVKKY